MPLALPAGAQPSGRAGPATGPTLLLLCGGPRTESPARASWRTGRYALAFRAWLEPSWPMADARWGPMRNATLGRVFSRRNSRNLLWRAL